MLLLRLLPPNVIVGRGTKACAVRLWHARYAAAVAVARPEEAALACRVLLREAMPMLRLSIGEGIAHAHEDEIL